MAIVLNPERKKRKKNLSLDEVKKITAKKREPDYVDKLVTERTKTYSTELPKKLRKEADKIREFFLSEIGPFMMAINAGTEEAREVAERTIEGKIDRAVFSRFEILVSKTIDLKMARFIAKWLDVSEEDIQRIMAIVQEKPAIIFTPKDVPKEKLGGSEKGKK